ncbi:hypothetical protein BCR41DRAFT_355030 [Lobosporangium transversale]|uniref:Uncharacterized protein n=1 Tax=Lobosporangium transversale TaxID=64571 RepID=A0A1Y2GKP3_9FUNG|nr:hypothetical protein BCR41DRAFT_355030 [Lobosporangium transversale]ORZ13814.1 hypothetical protein BCR41DRAFT_355030 [Lobosporangium transversale]|eukprot:XP_021880598.1 hypothetical protein BCR41DRAFT_355030 [Lobosporangium transversale]
MMAGGKKVKRASYPKGSVTMNALSLFAPSIPFLLTFSNLKGLFFARSLQCSSLSLSLSLSLYLPIIFFRGKLAEERMACSKKSHMHIFFNLLQIANPCSVLLHTIPSHPISSQCSFTRHIMNMNILNSKTNLY